MANLDRQRDAQTLNRGLAVQILAAALARLARQAGGAMRDDDGGLDLIAMLAARTAATRPADLAIGEEFGQRQCGRMQLRTWHSLAGASGWCHDGTVSDLPLSLGPSPSRNGTAFWAHLSGEGYELASSPNADCSMSVLMMPGLSGTAHIPSGNS